MKLNFYFTTIITLLVFLGTQANTFATVYYVDSPSSDTTGTGTMSSPWRSIAQINNHPKFQPGDQILFRRGASWTGLLRPKGSGDSTARILIGDYGDKRLPRPIINGGGARDEGINNNLADPNHSADDVLHGGAAILLHNQSFWTIEELTVTNTPVSLTLENLGFRQGIKIVADDSPNTNSGATVQYILIRKVTVENVFGRYHFEKGGKETGGINLFIYRPKNTFWSQKVLAKIQNVVIEDCVIQNINRCGIFSNGSSTIHAERSFDPNAYPITGLIIRRNIIENCTGDGVVVRYAESALVESNRAVNNHNGIESGPEGDDYEGHVGHGVALWCRSAKNTTFQYNEVYGTKGVKDATAFDADMTAENTLVQYNYSHDNEGGFMLFMRNPLENPGTIVRYNISHNDGAKANRIFHFSTYPENKTGGPTYFNATALIYNNTFYIHDTEYSETNSSTKIAISNTRSYKTKFYNNIFYQPTNVAILNRAGNFTLWQYNHYTNFSSVPTASPNIKNTTGFPDIDFPATAPTLSTIGMKNPGGNSILRNQLNAYQITSSSSPAYRTGKVMEDNGAEDIYGIAVSATSAPNKGAHNACSKCPPGKAGIEPANLMEFLAEKDVNTAMVLYPNPVTSKLFISNLPQGSYKVDVINPSGHKILSTTINNASIEVSGIPAGNYILVFPENREIKSQHFIKSN